ncbi:MAG: hypothetical protein G8345_18800 [Magnetococcales bacterium]|nr:hypothetical protein [Magnetococcales bacterium]
MNETAHHALTLQQVDVINLSLSKAMAVARVVAECSDKHRESPDDPPPASLYVVMLVVLDELEKIEEVMKSFISVEV